MKKFLLFMFLITGIATAEEIVIKDCTVPKVRNHMLIYHAADGRIIFGGDESVSKTPVKDPYYDDFIRVPQQKNYVIRQDGPDCVINTSDPIAPTTSPSSPAKTPALKTRPLFERR